MNTTERVKSKILSPVHIAERKIGVEIESFYYLGNDFSRIPVNYGKQYSALDLLRDISEEARINNELYSYSLEPGGQLEWASSPQISLWSIEKEYSKHIEYQKKLCKKNNIDVGHFSVEPISHPLDIDLIDSKKYRLMDDMFKNTGALGPWMMRNTTSLQLNIDYLNEEDANQMAFVADAIQPLASILFSNAPFIEGQFAGHENLRWKIWNATDKSRCRTLFDHNVKSPEGLIDMYVDWLLSRKAIFIENPKGVFDEFGDTLENMIQVDSSDHLIASAFRQIFTHVRFKTVLEIRACDRHQKGDEVVPAAFLTGLLTSEAPRDTLLEEIMSWTDEDRIRLSKSAQSVNFANYGPKNKSVGHWLEYLCQLSLDGLDERSKKFDIENEKPLIDVKLEKLISKGTLTQQIQDEYKKSKQSLKSFIRENYLDLHND